MPNGPYAGDLPVRVIPPNVFGEDLEKKRSIVHQGKRLPPTVQCRKGHPMTPENSSNRADGRKVCKACDRERRARKRKEKRNAHGRAVEQANP